MKPPGQNLFAAHNERAIQEVFPRATYAPIDACLCKAEWGDMQKTYSKIEKINIPKLPFFIDILLSLSLITYRWFQKTMAHHIILPQRDTIPSVEPLINKINL